MKIAFFSPSSPCIETDIEASLAMMVRELSKICPGVKIVAERSGSLSAGNANPLFPYLSGLDDEKTAIFEHLMQDPDCDFVLCTRGGYGAMRWVHLVDWRSVAAASCKLVGFSDVTVLFSAIINAGGTCVHGPMLNTLPVTAERSRQALWQALCSGEFPEFTGVPVKEGQFKGVLTGGNLACLCHLIGTPFEPDWKNKILFIEDCNEPAYKIDRMLTQMRLAGVFDMIGGMVLGRFTHCNQTGPGGLRELFEDRVSGFNFPVIADLPAGHGSENMPLMLGSIYNMSGSSGLLSPA